MHLYKCAYTHVHVCFYFVPVPTIELLEGFLLLLFFLCLEIYLKTHFQ